MDGRIRITKSENSIKIEIPAVDHRALSIMWMLISVASGVMFLVQMHGTQTYPLVLIWIIVMLVFGLKGLADWQWFTKGMEIFDVSPQRLMYVRKGAVFENKSKSIDSEDIKNINILQFGIGDNRLEILSKNQRILCGRNLSKAESRVVRELLLDFKD